MLGNATVLAAIATSAVTLIVAILTQRANARQAKVEHESSPYDLLADRVMQLETESQRMHDELMEYRRVNVALETDLRTMMVYANQLLALLRDQSPPPPPLPPLASIAQWPK